MIPHAIQVLCLKGGVGKSSLCSNAGVLAARAGYKVLLVDLDAQASLARDLGYVGKSDGGLSLFNSVHSGSALQPLRDVRENLDVVPAGDHTKKLFNLLQMQALQGEHDAPQVIDALAPIADDYDLILLDAPPTNPTAQWQGALCAHYLVIPDPGDDSSHDGTAQVFDLVRRAYESEANPYLEVLGVVMTLFPSNSKRLIKNAREELERMLPKDVPVLKGVVRFAKGPAIEFRKRGMVAAEYEEAAKSALSYWKARKNGVKPEEWHKSGIGLSEDYERITQELLTLFSSRQQDYLATAAEAL